MMIIDPSMVNTVQVLVRVISIPRGASLFSLSLLTNLLLKGTVAHDSLLAALLMTNSNSVTSFQFPKASCMCTSLLAVRSLYTKLPYPYHQIFKGTVLTICLVTPVTVAADALPILVIKTAATPYLVIGYI